MVRQRPARAILFGLLPGLLCCLALGCGGDKGYRFSGKVTHKGQPIASGKIYFIPDASKGNKGPTGYADIKNGEYDTSAPGGAGCIGGPMTIKIEAIDPSSSGKTDKSGESAGKALFPTYQVPMDLPKATTTQDFDVPASAGGGEKGKGGDPFAQ
jgi:hypothetical protein